MKRYRQTQDDDDHNIAVFLRNLANVEKRNARNTYNKNLFDKYKDSPKEYWRSINNLVNPKNQNPIFSLFDNINKSQVKSEDTANHINTYFATIGNKLAQHLDDPHTMNTPPHHNIFNFKECTLEEIN